MSDFLLQKSCRILQDNKLSKTSKKSEKQRLKKKKNSLATKQLEEIEFQKTILENLKKLEQFNRKSAVDVSKKVLPKCGDNTEKETIPVGEEPTVFTDKDFEDFEKEYFDS